MRKIRFTRPAHSARKVRPGPIAKVAGMCSTMIGLVLGQPAAAQMNTCGSALAQLQQFVFQVNQVAQWELYQGIPMRCQGNPMCGQMLFQQLDFWYRQQAGLANNYYMQIAQQCSSQAPTGIPTRPGEGGMPRVDEQDVTDLQVDDEDRTVRIRIPSTPQGFRPR